MMQQSPITLPLCVIYVREDNDSNVSTMITRLIYTTWAPMPAVPKRPLNLVTHPLFESGVLNNNFCSVGGTLKFELADWGCNF